MLLCTDLGKELGVKGEQILLSHSTATLSTAASPATLGLSTADIIGLPHCYCSTCNRLLYSSYPTFPMGYVPKWTDITDFRLMAFSLCKCMYSTLYIHNRFRLTIKSVYCNSVCCVVCCVRCDSGVGGPVVEWRVGQQYYLSRLRGLHLTQNTVLKEDCRLFHRKGES